jgi:histidinol-phosphate aminotransferase
VQGGVCDTVAWPADWSLPPALGARDAKLTFLCNPNSPSGTLVPIDEIDALAARLSGVLVVDEAYVDFAAATALPLVRRRANVVVLRTLSKSYSLAGLRVGLAFGAPALLAGLRTVKDSYNLNRLSQAAATAALADQATVRENVTRVARTRTRLVEAMRALGYDVPESHAMEGAAANAIETALLKARSALRWRRPTSETNKLVKSGENLAPTFMNDFPQPGALPIVLNGEVIGAMGVSSGDGEKCAPCLNPLTKAPTGACELKF